jgi:protein TonB
MVLRYLLAIAVAAVATFALVFLMQSLISMSGKGLTEGNAGHAIEFVRLKKDSDLELKKRRLPEKQEPEEPPPPPPLDLADAPKPGQDLGSGIAVAVPDFALAGGPNLGAPPSDADVIPLVRVNPQYPPRAISMGLEGWVEVEFTISAAGTVIDPVVVDSSSSLFHRSTLRAIKKWKYNPKIVDGTAVERKGVRVRLDYALNE